MRKQLAKTIVLGEWTFGGGRFGTESAKLVSTASDILMGHNYHPSNRHHSRLSLIESRPSGHALVRICICS